MDNVLQLAKLAAPDVRELRARMQGEVVVTLHGILKPHQSATGKLYVSVRLPNPSAGIEDHHGCEVVGQGVLVVDHGIPEGAIAADRS